MAAAQVEIVDVRVADDARNDLRADILSGLSQPADTKTLPTLLLYDERGLRIYDELTTRATEYYLFGAEETLLRQHAHEIARIMHTTADASGHVLHESVVLELGAGALRKTSHVLRALAGLVPDAAVATDGAAPPITYYALDLEERELRRTLGQLAESDVGPALKGRVATCGMWGTFDGGLRFVQEGGLRGRSAPLPLEGAFAARSRSAGSTASGSASASGGTSDTAPSTPDAGGLEQPVHLLFLGSSLGNFPRGADAKFLRALPLRRGMGDTLLIGLDHGRDKARIERAYDDPQGITARFIMNGLRGAGRALGDEGLFDEAKFEYVARYNEDMRRHEAFYKSKVDQTIRDPQSGREFALAAGELVGIEVSNKYSEEDAWRVFTDADLRPIQRWVDADTGYALWLLERPPFAFPLFRPTALASTPFGCPAFADFQDMWAAWDFVTRKMIPDSMLLQKPIDLRHICLFYTGHIPTFLDIHLSRLLQEPHTEPDGYKYIFERGIDPIVDNPEECHPHSEVPTKDEDWPSLINILQFQSRVRQRLRALYDDIASGKRQLTRRMARVLMLTLEHEGFHIETLLYMLLQRAGTGTIPPSASGFHLPPWESLAAGWAAAPKLSTPTVTLGPATVYLGHDDAEADDTRADGTHVLYDPDSELGWDNEHPRRAADVGEFRIEWRPVTNGQFFEFWNDRKDEIEMPKSWVEQDGAVMVRTLDGPVPLRIAYDWPVQTDYVSLSTYASVKGGRLPTEPELRLFFDKFECGFEGGKNAAFRNWHPVPATTGLDAADGKGHNGGVWEWTSTVFDKYEGFEPMSLYPGYSTDFFDERHNVVIGSSYATFPRLADRRSLRNYYQRIYPYAWVGARVVYDN
ncbi:hypothetical protein K488DRAFT_89904 [Vararia minispora EC-137]|uniref:Uncharacterized protein n=1 Tax=Vararia minispora EC-137 TaxID=1314806 RepID=A0ACB8QAI1_9AGAM|nr:hypothetical protein K488DRAFT_89904 [Vararia minispora EC-137]